MFSVARSSLLLTVLTLAMAACATPAPPLPTIVPTEPPTSTLMPPTATPLPTNTPIPPTKTPLPTATLRPTDTSVPTATPLPTNTPTPAPTKAVTPKPTNTKGAAAPVAAGGGVSSKPSNLATSIEQSFNAALGIVSHINEMAGGAGVEVCAPLIAKYQGIHNAPTYDMAGQSTEMQNAYAAYRNGVNLVDTLGPKILSCGQNGGPIGALDLGAMQYPLRKAVESFGQARDWTQRAVTISADSSLIDAVKRVQTAISQIDLAYQRAGSGQTEDCDPFINEHNILVNAPAYDVSAEPAHIQNAYALYRHGIELALTKTSIVVDMCNRGGGLLGRLDYGLSLPVLREAQTSLIQALSLLGQ
jgi:hypothetical protein